ncbi:MAG TPA: glucosaminidase domain-containing protein [Chitinophagaceae bacterium]
MQKLRFTFILFFILLGKLVFAQSSATIREYIQKYQAVAISEMIRTGVPAAITLAQGIHETQAGQSDLVLRSNNHFGIKCKSNWTGESVSHTDDAPNECFRKYNCAEDSYKDHSDFLKNGSRYAFLFNLDPTDFEAWAQGLKKAGYATNPRYPAILIKLINDYNLEDYTLIAMGKLSGDKNGFFVNTDNSAPAATQAVAFVEKELPAVNYPEGEFTINDTRVVYAKKNTPFLTLAQRYRVSLKRIFEFNDNMPEEEVVPFDQLIYLQRKRKTGLNEFHIVQKNETIYDIAQIEAIRLESLLHLNMLTEDVDPAPGEKLYLRSKAPSRPRLITGNSNQSKSDGSLTLVNKDEQQNKNFQPVPSFASYKEIVHVVKPKEGLYFISKKYDVSVNDIKDWNQLQGNDLKIGQELKIIKQPHGQYQGTR